MAGKSDAKLWMAIGLSLADPKRRDQVLALPLELFTGRAKAAREFLAKAKDLEKAADKLMRDLAREGECAKLDPLLGRVQAASRMLDPVAFKEWLKREMG